MKLRSPTGVFIIGVTVTILLALVVAIALLSTKDGEKALEANAPLVAAVVALGGVGTAQMVSIALDHNRAQDEALQAYLAEMSKLLLDKDLHEESADYAAARVTARLQTVAVLERLDAGRKRTVLLFLREAQLIHRINRLDPDTTTKPKVLFHAHYVGLRDADLSGANLREAHLLSTSGDYPISLKGANLKNAKFCRAILRGADLSGADLRGADLYEADLREADLREAMRVTNEKLEHMGGLSGADLHGEGLLRVKLNGADLRGAKHLTQGQLELAIGDNETKLSSYLKPPTHWGVKVDEQSKGG